MVSSDSRSVGELERRIEAFDATEPGEMTADELAELTDTLVALADAYGNQGAFDAEAKMIARLDRLRQTDQDDTVVHLANALANATSVRGREDVYETTIDPDRLDAYRERVETLYEHRSEPAVAAPLARATVETIHANAKGGRRDSIGPLTERLEQVYTAHPEPDIAASLSRAYAHAERYHSANDAQLDGPLTEADVPPDRVARVEELYADHPDGEVAAGLAGILARRTTADAERTDVDTIAERIGRIEALADRHPAQADLIRRWLAVATANATRASFDAADPSRVEHWASVTFDHHETLSTPSTATWAAMATFFSARASFFDGDVEAGETKLERLATLERRYDNPVFAQWLARSMFDAARSYVETNHPERARSMVDDLAAFAVGHEDRDEIEAGLEALLSHAPHVFDVTTLDNVGDGVEELSGETSDGSGSDADGASVTDSTAPTTTPTVESAGVHRGGDGAPNASTPDASAAHDPRPPETRRMADSDVTADATTTSDERLTNDATGGSTAPGCGNCGDDGCGNCGSAPDLKPPASGPTLALAGAAVVLVSLSVLYTLYRTQRAVRKALRDL